MFLAGTFQVSPALLPIKPLSLLERLAEVLITMILPVEEIAEILDYVDLLLLFYAGISFF